MWYRQWVAYSGVPTRRQKNHIFHAACVSAVSGLRDMIALPERQQVFEDVRERYLMSSDVCCQV